MSEVVVFAGPCLPLRPDGEWRRLLECVQVRPPAQRGDMLAALVDRPRTLVLLDGYYYSKPAVSHKEILYALDAGVRVVGASSMGALRAAEMEPFGMIGVGEVFEDYRDGTLEGDDEVAILHLPESYGYQALTVALVELRYSVARLVERRRIDAAAAQRLIQAVKQLPFSRRRKEVVSKLAIEYLGEAASALDQELAENSLKRQDAQQAVRLALDGYTAASTRVHAPTEPFNQFRQLYFRRSTDCGTNSTTYMEAWMAAQVAHPYADQFVRRIRRRFLLASVSQSCGLLTAPRRVAEIGRHVAAQLEANGNHLPEPEYLEEARQEAAAELARATFASAGENAEGAEERALAELAGRLGLPRRHAEERLLELLSRDPESISPWHLARSFLRAPASISARRAAAAAKGVYICFRDRFGSDPIATAELLALAAELWRVSPAQVGIRALQLGLFGIEGPAFRNTLERFVPAERLPQPINDYPSCRVALAAASLDIEAIPESLAHGLGESGRFST